MSTRDKVRTLAWLAIAALTLVAGMTRSTDGYYQARQEAVGITINK
jgi:hypothetical protein